MQFNFDEKTLNYIVIIAIIIVVLFFYKNSIMNVLKRIKEILLSLIPKIDFIYV